MDDLYKALQFQAQTLMVQNEEHRKAVAGLQANDANLTQAQLAATRASMEADAALSTAKEQAALQAQQQTQEVKSGMEYDNLMLDLAEQVRTAQAFANSNRAVLDRASTMAPSDGVVDWLAAKVALPQLAENVATGDARSTQAAAHMKQISQSLTDVAQTNLATQETLDQQLLLKLSQGRRAAMESAEIKIKQENNQRDLVYLRALNEADWKQYQARSDQYRAFNDEKRMKLAEAQDARERERHAAFMEDRMQNEEEEANQLRLIKLGAAQLGKSQYLEGINTPKQFKAWMSRMPKAEAEATASAWQTAGWNVAKTAMEEEARIAKLPPEARAAAKAELSLRPTVGSTPGEAMRVLVNGQADIKPEARPLYERILSLTTEDRIAADPQFGPALTAAGNDRTARAKIKEQYTTALVRSEYAKAENGQPSQLFTVPAPSEVFTVSKKLAASPIFKELIAPVLEAEGNSAKMDPARMAVMSQKAVERKLVTQAEADNFASEYFKTERAAMVSHGALALGLPPMRLRKVERVTPSFGATAEDGVKYALTGPVAPMLVLKARSDETRSFSFDVTDPSQFAAYRMVKQLSEGRGGDPWRFRSGAVPASKLAEQFPQFVVKPNQGGQ